MRVKFFPVIRRIELLREKVLVPITKYTSANVKEMRRVFELAVQNFEDSWSAIATPAGVSYQKRVMNHEVMNFPDGDLMYIMFGWSFSILMAEPFAGTQIQDWLLQSAEETMSSSDMHSRLYNLAPGGSLTDQDVLKQLKQAILDCPTWIKVHEISDVTKCKAEILKIKNLMNLLTTCIATNLDSEREAAYIFSTIIEWAIQFKENFDPDQIITEPKSILTEIVPMYQTLLSTSALADTFKAWYRTSKFRAIQERIREKYAPIDAQGVRITNGNVMLPTSFYMPLVDIAVHDELLSDLDFTLFFKAI